ncbi:hypothetical protein [Streptomyces sp. NPDC050264]|uniref:hypothetical protein n=1 Tax=Streptomyces sp. NPDC050264 TaxID=3155038 RepID=UPI003430FB6C
MTAAELLDQALSEDAPTGKFGGPLSELLPVTAEQQAQHRAEVCEALRGWRWRDDTRISAARRA